MVWALVPVIFVLDKGGVGWVGVGSPPLIKVSQFSPKIDLFESCVHCPSFLLIDHFPPHIRSDDLPEVPGAAER
jgi:hypothetical protein